MSPMNNQQQPAVKLQKVRNSGVGTGTTSLLMIFTVLCFATLAMLSLSTANSNSRIQERGLARTATTALAEGQAAEKLAQIDGALQSASGADEQAYYTAALDAAKQLGCVVNQQSRTVEFSIPIDENSEFATVLILLPPEAEERYRVQTQAVRVTGEWQPEPEGQLWTPAA